MKKNIVLFCIISFFIVACNQNKILKTHGVAYLKKKEKLIIVNQSNKNDTISILGIASTTGMIDNNLWIYIERTMTKGNLLKFGRNFTKKNNVLIVEFNKFGIVEKKKFYEKEDMNKITFVKAITTNDIRKENFIHSFLSSVRQKMLTRRK